MQAPARAQALLCSRGSAARPVRGCRCASATPSRGPEAAASLVAGALAVLLATASPCGARLEGVNNPSLLPAGDPVPVLDVAGFLSKGQVARLTARVEKLERDTGVRLRVLVQSYPQTPGLAVRDWWRVDDSTVVFVADPGLGNLVNVNVGKDIDLRVPPAFWGRLASKYGTKFYWQAAGEDAAVEATVNAIDTCLREPISRGQCSTVQE